MTNWRVSAAVLSVFLVSMAGWPGPAEAQRITMYACADAQLESYGVNASAFQPVLCRGEFSATDPYLVLYAQVAPVSRETDIAIELLDPEGVTALTRAGVLTPVPGEPTSFTFSYVLPLAADTPEVMKKFPLLNVIVLGRPARERPGVWTWKISLRPGSSATLRFTVKP